MDDLLKKIAEESNIEPSTVEDILSLERKHVYKKKRHIRGDIKEIITTSVDKEAQER